MERGEKRQGTDGDKRDEEEVHGGRMDAEGLALGYQVADCG